MMLVDTSVWIEVFRRRRPLDLESVVPLDQVVVCLPIIQEILQGFQDERAYRIARESLLAMQVVESPLSMELFERTHHVSATPSPVSRRSTVPPRVTVRRAWRKYGTTKPTAAPTTEPTTTSVR